MKVSLFYLIHPANSNSREISGILTRLPCFMSNFLTRLLHIVSQAIQSKQLLTKEICLLSEETKYIFFQRKEKKCNLFIYLMNPDNSNVKKIKKKNSSTQPLGH